MKTSASLIPSRLAKRAHFDLETIYPILDEAIVCTISFTLNLKPFSIPTSFVRYGDKLYIHGSVGSHFIRELEKGIPACIVITLIDALVIARSAFHHSVNYRSVVLFASAEKVEDEEEKMQSFEWLTNKMVPGSWDYLRPATAKEVQKTTVLSFRIEEVSSKIRTGMPNDEEEDQSLPIWSGLIPLQTRRMPAIADDFSQDIPLPPHLQL